jgi:hypothetical protein
MIKKIINNLKLKIAVNKIREETESVISDSDKKSLDIVLKILEWQDSYDYIEWERFRDQFFLCDRCKGYSDDNCLCYAR